MATFRNKTMVFSSGKQSRVAEGCLSISPSMEISEGRGRMILGADHGQDDDAGNAIINEYQLTPEEVAEMADTMIKLWREVKERAKKYGVKSMELFY